MTKLWKKNVEALDEVEAYCFGEGAELDNKIVKEDVYGSIAHAHVIKQLGIISEKELNLLIKTLKNILKLHSDGKFVVTIDDEDVHTKVENFLTQELGELGKKIHTARSRNDQISVDMRLHSKFKIIEILNLITDASQQFIEYAQKYEFVPMPGYTHMQKAMPSSLGMWMSSFVESLFDDIELLKNAYQLSNLCPLGSGAAYGVSLSIDRELSAKLLGFSGVAKNSLYAQVSRAKLHSITMQSLVQVMITLSRFATDMLLFTTSEYNFFQVKPELCTGSSIMPQKKNLDIMEFLRAKTHVVKGYEQTVSSIIAGLPSGYNSDFSETKGPLIKSFEIVFQSLHIVKLLLKSMTPNISILKHAMTKELYATHAAYELVKKGMPFREAYVKIGLSLSDLPHYDPQKILKSSDHTGGTGNLKLDELKKQLNSCKKWIESAQKFQANVIINLIS